MKTIDVLVCGIGLLGPGLTSWSQARPLLRQPSAWIGGATVVPPPARMPATERRRAGTVVKASIVAADDALANARADASADANTDAMTPIDPARIATVFTSSTGDPTNCHLLCEALAAPERAVSPTRFTNSVHNAPAGYWHIAAASRAPSTSLAAFDASFGAGLLEAAVQCIATQAPVLLVACDVPYPEPLHAVRPVADTFAAALLIVPPGAVGGRPLRLRLTAEEDSATPCDHAGLEGIRQAIPAARALPLLQALARDAATHVALQAQAGLGLLIEIDAA